jgi:DNA-binding CsgD family transcriptional regulator
VTPYFEQILVQLEADIKDILHPLMLDRMMFGTGMKLSRTVVAEAAGPQAVSSPRDHSGYLRCSEWMRTNWKWDVTVSTVSNSTLLVTCRTCLFPDMVKSDSHMCRMEMGILSGISGRLFNYGKVSLQRSHDHPPCDCKFTVHTERTPQSIAADGWSWPLATQNDERSFDVEAGAQIRTQLTLREQQILALLAEGFSDKQIATALNLSVRTIEGHLGRVREKTDLHSRSALIRFALRIAKK